MCIEGIDTIFRRLHDRAPAALDRFLEQLRQHVFHGTVVKVIEQNFSHVGSIAGNAAPTSRPRGYIRLYRQQSWRLGWRRFHDAEQHEAAETLDCYFEGFAGMITIR